MMRPRRLGSFQPRRIRNVVVFSGHALALVGEIGLLGSIVKE